MNPRSDAMLSDPELIEWIVREVVRRLKHAGYRTASPSPGDAATSTNVAANRELRLSERLVTLATLEGRLAGVARVVVPLRAVVTPAVRDELKQKNIRLEKD